jgi:hypothetical protein
VLEGIKISAGILKYNSNSFFNLFFLDERGAPFICLFYSLWIFHFYSLFDLAEASAMLKNFLFPRCASEHGACISTAPGFPQRLGKEQHNIRHQGRQTIQERDGMYI